MVDRLAVLVELFAIDLCANAVMSNHYHVVLKVDRARAEAWSLGEVAERWMGLFSAPWWSSAGCVVKRWTQRQ